jgi:hypothetical protein
MESPMSADILLRYFFVVSHNISDSTVSERFSWPPFLQLSDDLWDLLALIFASQNQRYLVVFPSFDPDHDFKLLVAGDGCLQSNETLDG